jgi:hypothetical protein
MPARRQVLYLEDLAPGQRFGSAALVVEASDIKAFAGRAS